MRRLTAAEYGLFLAATAFFEAVFFLAIFVATVLLTMVFVTVRFWLLLIELFELEAAEKLGTGREMCRRKISETIASPRDSMNAPFEYLYQVILKTVHVRFKASDRCKLK